MKLTATAIERFALLVLAILLMFTVRQIHGQNTVGAALVQGVVKDSTGAIIPGATVTLSNENGKIYQTQTKGDGHYIVRGLTPGTYTVKVVFSAHSLRRSRSVICRCLLSSRSTLLTALNANFTDSRGTHELRTVDSEPGYSHEERRHRTRLPGIEYAREQNLELRDDKVRRDVGRNKSATRRARRRPGRWGRPRSRRRWSGWWRSGRRSRRRRPASRRHVQ